VVAPSITVSIHLVVFPCDLIRVPRRKARSNVAGVAIRRRRAEGTRESQCWPVDCCHTADNALRLANEPDFSAV
jgi:hypothetical protein